VHVIFVGNTKVRLLVTASERSERGGLVSVTLKRRDCFGIITPRNDPFLVTASERSERGGLPITVGAGLDPAPFIILGNHKGCPYNIISDI